MTQTTVIENDDKETNGEAKQKLTKVDRTVKYPQIAPEELVLVTDPKHPLYDPRVHNEPSDEFVRNVKEFGVITPIVVHVNTENGKYEVAAGRMRTKAQIEANKELKKAGLQPRLIRYVLQNTNEELSLMSVMAIENEFRTASKPSQRAELAARMIDRGQSEDNLQVVFGISKGTVRNLLALNQCTVAVRKAVDTGKLGVAHAYKLAKLHPAEQGKKLDEILALGEGDDEDEEKEEKAGKGKKKATKKSKRAKAKKVREIVSGKAGMRGKREILKMRKAVDKTKTMGADKRIIVLAVLDWICGDNDALSDFMEVPTDEKEEKKK